MKSSTAGLWRLNRLKRRRYFALFCALRQKMLSISLPFRATSILKELTDVEVSSEHQPSLSQWQYPPNRDIHWQDCQAVPCSRPCEFHFGWMPDLFLTLKWCKAKAPFRLRHWEQLHHRHCANAKVPKVNVTMTADDGSSDSSRKSLQWVGF